MLGRHSSYPTNLGRWECLWPLCQRDGVWMVLGFTLPMELIMDSASQTQPKPCPPSLYGQTKLVARLKQSPSRMALTLSRSREVMSVASSWGLPRLPRVGQGLLTHQARCLC